MPTLPHLVLHNLNIFVCRILTPCILISAQDLAIGVYRTAFILLTLECRILTNNV